MIGAGKVFLVGAGPGDPKLLTLRAAEVLRDSDVVLYDRLVNPAILDLALRAEHIYVGKEPWIESSTRQAAIHAEMIDHARRGKTVVRLKGGDPFVFGRGGEEALALAQAKIAFEVIPGVSSALAVPASANIPVTHRNLATAFAVFAGHTEKGGLSEELWQVAAKIPTAVFLMGVDRLPMIVAKLIEQGRPESTPIALISNGTLPEETVVEGTLGTIIGLAAGVFPPCTIVVGSSVEIRSEIGRLVAMESSLQ